MQMGSQIAHRWHLRVGPHEPLSMNIEHGLKELEVQDGISYIANNKHHNEIWWYLIKREFMVSTGIRFIEGKWMEDRAQ